MKLSSILITLLCFFSINTYANDEIDKLTLPIMESIHKGEISNIFSMAFPKGSASRRYFSDSDIEQYDNQFQNSFKHWVNRAVTLNIFILIYLMCWF